MELEAAVRRRDVEPRHLHARVDRREARQDHARRHRQRGHAQHGHVLEAVVVAGRDVHPAQRRPHPRRVLHVAGGHSRHLGVVGHADEAGGQRRRPAAARQRQAAGHEGGHDDEGGRGGRRRQPQGGRPQAELLVVDHVEVVVGVEVVGRVEDVGGAPDEELLAERRLQRPAAQAEHGLLQIEQAAPPVLVLDLEVHPVGEVVVVLAQLANYPGVAPRRQPAGDLQAQDALVADVLRIGGRRLEVREVLDDRGALEAEGGQAERLVLGGGGGRAQTERAQQREQDTGVLTHAPAPT